MIKVSKLKEAISKYGTPLYVYDLDIIEKQYIELKNSMSNIKDLKIYFAAKALSNISILNYFKSLGTGLETSSIEEVKIGLKCGFNKDDILYSPNGVGLEEIIEANNLGVKLNLDSLESIEAFTENYSGREISIRINPDIYAGGNERISVGHRDSKFGISEDKLSRLVKIEEEGKLIVSGIHVHTGSDILKNEELELTVNKIFKIARKFKNLKSINLGGFNHFIRTTLYNSYHEIIKLNNNNDEKETYNVVGYICEKDTFAQQRTINKLKVGDLICFKNAGAYCFSMSSNYNSRVKPAEACIINNKIKLIRKRETVENLLKNQINIFVK